MGQKINPILFQLTKNNRWKSKYFEKIITESSIYSKKDQEIRNFIVKFLKIYKMVLHNCKLYYFNQALHIFVSYHQNLNFFFLKRKSKPTEFTFKKIFKSLKIIKKLSKKSFIKQNTKSFFQVIPTIQVFESLSKFINVSTLEEIQRKISKLIYKYFNKLKTFRSKIPTSDLEKHKNVLLDHLKLKIFFLKNYNTWKKLKTKFFLKNLFQILTSFTQKRIKFFLVIKELKFNVKWSTTHRKTKSILKKNIAILRKYQKNKFFKEGINTLFNCAINKESSKLLAQFLSNELKRLKHHNFFIRFIQNTLKLFKNNLFSKFKGIKIEIKGRLNRHPRAKKKIIKIANSVSVLKIESIIDYSEKTVFTPNGTLGIKVWIHEL